MQTNEFSPSEEDLRDYAVLYSDLECPEDLDTAPFVRTDEPPFVPRGKYLLGTDGANPIVILVRYKHETTIPYLSRVTMHYRGKETLTYINTQVSEILQRIQQNPLVSARAYGKLTRTCPRCPYTLSGEQAKHGIHFKCEKIFLDS